MHVKLRQDFLRSAECDGLSINHADEDVSQFECIPVGIWAGAPKAIFKLHKIA